MRLTFDLKDRFLCIKYESANYMEPTKTTLWWPICEVRAEDVADLIGQPARDLGNGAYSGRYAGIGYDSTFYTKDGAKTLPIASQVDPIAAPKVRKGIVTRWYNGSWQKYSQTKGWVLA